jgi:GAF domain-containing protein
MRAGASPTRVPFAGPSPVCQSLHSYQVLDTDPEQEYDDIVRAAATLLGCPFALVSLVDADRQWFKARFGLDLQEAPREHGICAIVIQHTEGPLVVSDARADPRLACNKLVTGAPGICFYAGAALVSPDRAALGAVCVIDRKPRAISAGDRGTLRHLAGMTMVALEARRDQLGD